LAGEWTGIDMYELKSGAFVSYSESLSSYHGWWRSATSADLDGDGDLDLVFGNNGGNNYLRPDKTHPVKMWVNQYDQSANRQVIFTRTVNGKDVPVFLKKELTDQIPSLKKQNLRHDAYADKSIQELFSPELIKSSQVEVYDFSSSCIAWNEGGGKFTVQVMPFDAQVSTITAIQTADVNNDGKLDLLLGFNQYDWLPQFSRMDAGYGGVLLNQGKRSFQFLQASQSGIQIIGETRDIKPITIQGKPSYLFVQNNSKPIIYQYNNK
jgi:hypothetical protein